MNRIGSSRVPMKPMNKIGSSNHKKPMNGKSTLRTRKRTGEKDRLGEEEKEIAVAVECISPQIPQLAIIGFSESVAVLFTSEMKCKWLAELLDGNIKLPCIADMNKDILDWDMFYKRYSGEPHKRSCVTALHIWYNDQLCKDMGWNPKRKKNMLAEMFEPYGPWDYGHK
ncbi:hypothetical protein LIER_11185 [Lithospermum erythrorhizon]|uniref:Uncharacterized protein n=1 Tax=Lithospermum erythrorhizon TaxID=34254 RepID=A0AAV3PRG5_LITER